MQKADFIEPEMIYIPAGDFLMGSEKGAENEAPVHRVYGPFCPRLEFPLAVPMHLE